MSAAIAKYVAKTGSASANEIRKVLLKLARIFIAARSSARPLRYQQPVLHQVV